MSYRTITLIATAAAAAGLNVILNGVFNDSGDNLQPGARASATGEDPATHYFAQANVTETQFEALHDLKDTNICPAKYRGALSEEEANAAVAALQIYPLQEAAQALQAAGLQQVFDQS